MLFEKESEAGGLCRSTMVDGAPLDVGGGHFLDMGCKRALDFLFAFMPRDEWREFKRVSTIRLRGVEVEYPLEGNLWQLPLDAQVDFLESIARAGVAHGTPKPSTFDAWIRWKLGDRIADEYLLPYNRKLWSLPLSDIGIDWLHKLPAVSFRETLRSCLERKSSGKLPAHGRFLYPRAHGYGEVWRRIAESLGNHFVPSYSPSSIDLDTRTIDGTIRAEFIVSTIPWTIWPLLAQLPETIQGAIASLVHTSIHVDYHPENVASLAHWIYGPNEGEAHHRLLLRHNFREGARGYWTETNARRARAQSGPRFVNDFAYPVSTVGRSAAIRTILDWFRGRGVIGLGRWGTWQHINSDVAVDLALKAAATCLGKD